MEAAISVKNVGKSYRLSPGPGLKGVFARAKAADQGLVAALDGVSFEVRPGETLGVVGRNGSGKSTLLGIICGVIRPSAGEVAIQGRVSAILELGAGFDPEFSGLENVYMSGALMGYTRQDMDRKMPSILRFADIGDFVRHPVKTYSSGMYVRLAFSLAINVEPDILVIDEVLSVGDEAFQYKCFSRIKELQEKGVTILLVSHDSSAVMDLCDRVLLLEGGRLLLSGPPRQVVAQYLKLIFTGAGPDPHAPQGGLDAPLEYGPRGASVENPRILTPEGGPVPVLVRGREYVYTYDVSFEREAADVRFGMMIKTKTGLELGGMASHKKGKGIARVAQNALARPRFVFRCLLAPGKYFLNAGVTGAQNGEEAYLHRIVDALMFTVAPEDGLQMTGTVDFSCDASVEIEER